MNKFIFLFFVVTTYQTTAQTCTATNTAELNACFASTPAPGIISLGNTIALSGPLDVPLNTFTLYTHAFDITGNTWGWEPNGAGSIVNTSTDASGTVISVAKNGTYRFTDINSAGSLRGAFAVLSAELSIFKGQFMEGRTVLSWQMADEKNTRDFSVERGNDGKTFEKIGNVQTKGTHLDYTFTDAQIAATSTVYYRLAINNFDGKTVMSNVIAMTGKNALSALKCYPSVTSHILTLEAADETIFNVINLLGQQVLTGKTTRYIDVSALSKGTYIVKVGRAQAKFIKQ